MAIKSGPGLRAVTGKAESENKNSMDRDKFVPFISECADRGRFGATLPVL